MLSLRFTSYGLQIVEFSAYRVWALGHPMPSTPPCGPAPYFSPCDAAERRFEWQVLHLPWRNAMFPFTTPTTATVTTFYQHYATIYLKCMRLAVQRVRRMLGQAPAPSALR